MVEACVEGRRQRLAAGDQCSTSPPAVAIVLFVRWFALNNFFDNLLHVANFDQDVLGLQIGMNDATLPVQIVKAEQDLFRDLLHQRHRNAPMIPFLDQTQQVFAQDLENHTYVCTIGSFVFERVEETDDVFSAGVIGLRRNDPLQELDLVDGGLGVVRGGTNDFERDMFPRCVIP